jgi:hypothetical protein
MPVPSAIYAAIVNSVISAVADLPPSSPEAAMIALSRAFPADSKLGELTPPVQRELQINGSTLFASPGLQLRGPNNLILMPGAIQGAVPIRYQLDLMGNVHRIWILTAAEVAAANSQ